VVFELSHADAGNARVSFPGVEFLVIYMRRN